MNRVDSERPPSVSGAKAEQFRAGDRQIRATHYDSHYPLIISFDSLLAFDLECTHVARDGHVQSDKAIVVWRLPKKGLFVVNKSQSERSRSV
ncbi:hypothetical protein TcasGA2_TC004571 [Tribolium castaneum]|uniref:Uncharacterized protein n=1 Tax=Tribolium castaneum TaxID=7070 RepID=D6WB71_TRICA|nr:hypothetical protein TcasGA2_TC004571 [Tribolium castaneum]